MFNTLLPEALGAESEERRRFEAECVGDAR